MLIVINNQKDISGVQGSFARHRIREKGVLLPASAFLEALRVHWEISSRSYLVPFYGAEVSRQTPGEVLKRAIHLVVDKSEDFLKEVALKVT